MWLSFSGRDESQVEHRGGATTWLSREGAPRSTARTGTGTPFAACFVPRRLPEPEPLTDPVSECILTHR